MCCTLFGRMSTVHVFVGQCGNQLGTAFLDAIASEAEASGSEEYQMLVSAKHFRPARRRPRKPSADASDGGRMSRWMTQEAPPAGLPQPRCVMVDMEPKVIEEALKRVNGSALPAGSLDDSLDNANPYKPLYSLAPEQCVTRGEGSANNWAYGYGHQGESRREAITECLRRESEANENGASISTYNVVHSVAGGTGSGVGCLIAEVIKDAYPHAVLMHSIVWPFANGEVATQWYNTVLCMSHLRDAADAVCIAYNDVVANRLTRARARAASGGALREAESSVHYDAINQQIGYLWAPLHLPELLYTVPPPLRDTTRHRIPQESVVRAAGRAPLPAPRRHARSEDVLEALALDPARKLFTGTSAPNDAVAWEHTTGSAGGTSSWSAVLADAARTSRETFASSGLMGVSRGSALWVLRGQHSQTEALRALQDMMVSELKQAAPGSLFVSPDAGHKTDSQARVALTSRHASHEVFLYGHAPVIPAQLEVAVQHVEKQLHVGAYTHPFESYGVDKGMLRDCTMRLWDTIYAYAGDG